MAQKRPFDEEVVNEVSSKHPRQDGPSDEIFSPKDNPPMGNGPDKPYDSAGQASSQNNGLEHREEHVNDSFPEIPSEDNIGDIETEVPRSASLSHWATSSTSDDDEPQELVHVPFFPGYFSFDRPVRSVINPDDVYYCLLDYPPRKRVPVGPEYQAEIPELDSLGAASEPTASDRNSAAVNDGVQLEGICIIPNPETDPLTYNVEKVGDGRTDCSCPDQGSIRCVRQHITEARNKLRITLGQETFTELGFYDMGEVVAEKWSEEEEQLFHDVVYANPASMGRNFWNALSAVFPSRTKMEIVSYYFNVFMLRKRAAQNRSDPFNIDSDNDEWQEEEEEDDSGVESPVRQNGLEFHFNALHGQEHQHDDDHGDDDDDENGDLSDDDDQETGDKSDPVFTRKSDPDDILGKQMNHNDDVGENDAHDGSCTSSDSGAPMQGPQMMMKPDNNCQEWRDYIIDTDATKGWDSYNNMSSCPRDVDFMPTSMIEEVFGDADSESKRDDRW